MLLDDGVGFGIYSGTGGRTNAEARSACSPRLPTRSSILVKPGRPAHLKPTVYVPHDRARVCPECAGPLDPGVGLRELRAVRLGTLRMSTDGQMGGWADGQLHTGAAQ